MATCNVEDDDVCSIEQKTTGDVTVTANASSRNGGGGNWQVATRAEMDLVCCTALHRSAAYSRLFDDRGCVEPAFLDGWTFVVQIQS